jgi:hypothetical protein
MKKKLTELAIGVILLSAFLQTVTAQWVQTNGPYGGRVNALAVSSGNNIFAGTLRGGVFPFRQQRRKLDCGQ